MAQILLIFHYCGLLIQQAWCLCGGTRRKSGRDSTRVCKCLLARQIYKWFRTSRHWQLRMETCILENTLEVLASADSRRNSELPQLGCVHFPRWQEETSRFERPQSPGSTYEANSWGRFVHLSFYAIFCILLLMFCNDLLIFCLSFLDFDSETCLSWWSLYFPDLQTEPFLTLVSKSHSLFIATFSQRKHQFALEGRFADPPRKVWPWRGRTHRDQVAFWIPVTVGPLWLHGMSQMSLWWCIHSP